MKLLPNRQQFYFTVVYLTTNKLCICVLANLVFSQLLAAGRALKTMMLGSLRESEVELLSENMRFAITETCLALTIFREELSVWMVGAFTVQLFTKTFHWLAQARVEHVGRTEGTTIVQHLKLFALQVMLLAFDVAVLHRIYQKEMLNLFFLHIDNDAPSHVVRNQCLVYAQTVVGASHSAHEYVFESYALCRDNAVHGSTTSVLMLHVHCECFVLFLPYFYNTQQPSALILITFEFAIMAVVAVTTLTKGKQQCVLNVPMHGAKSMHPCMQQSTAYCVITYTTV
eukprot:13057-Heterococcus_DN1.PRE.3